ncbi:hypothetical protein [cf. Phormidesmis sp. LEGE 11477]|uniref:hypothetical protein n=1 Tax=cf. Phormidesmis sp. LEGE 11477 TaxID=1828680 RepID=UPI0018830499|nr:hypothetical protein [cf. Phormidesmis sp. LEGE 11477]MBE9064860.1 hypothetical protein [cf. Phormidesmis sp. LEGE 11477]
MDATRFLLWAIVGVVIGVASSLLDWQMSSWTYLISILLLLEIVIKFLFMWVLSPLKFTTAEPGLWTDAAQEELAQYTTQLNRLGFEQLTDYTIPADEDNKPVARLFVHPQKFCFAEIGKVGNAPIFCSISGQLEKTWTLAVTNTSVSSSTAAVSYAFLRLPHRLFKLRKDASADVLMQTFEDWRSQVSNHLNLGHAKNITAKDYFVREQEARTNQRKALLYKSITWGLIELFWFNLSPKAEWLGAYQEKSVAM